MSKFLKIEREDALNKGRRKLNHAIVDSSEAKEDAIKALAKSLSAEQIAQLAQLKSDETQQQLDNIIIESGTSDAEVLQARGEYPLLKDRLDSTTQQLSEKEEDIQVLNDKKMDKNTNDISISQINKNKGLIDETYLSDELKAQMGDGSPIHPTPADNSITTVKYINQSVTKNKLNIPDENLLPKTFEFKVGEINRSGINERNLERAYSDFMNVKKGDSLKSQNDIVFTVWVKSDEDEENEYNHYVNYWTTSHLFTSDVTVRIGVKYNDDETVVDHMHVLENSIYLKSEENAVSIKKHNEHRPIKLTYEMGEHTSSGFRDSDKRVRNKKNLRLKKGDLIHLKNKENTRYSIYIEGEGHYKGGWLKDDVSLPDDVSVVITQKFEDDRIIKDNDIDFFVDNIEIFNDDSFIRKKDLRHYISEGLAINFNNLKNYGLVQSEKNIDGEVTTGIRDNNVYPLASVWGHEYLYSWYNKLKDDKFVTMTWAGDSTTLNSGLEAGFKRNELAEKILTLGGYDKDLISSINAGHGTQHTGNWLGGEYDEDKRTEKGFLDEDMKKNPDLYVFSYGFNDGSNSHFPSLSWKERVERFEENLNIGLSRIRGEKYNKDADEMAIILTTPISAYSDSRGNTPQKWNDRIRPIIQEACREYKCAFVDITARQYDHNFSNSWSTNGDWVHPNETANVDYMSMFEGLIFPRLLHR